MSDQPPIDTENADESSELAGGWSAPRTPGAWRAPEQKPQPEGWRVPVLPKDVTSEAEGAGEWHLPSPDDTIYTADDEIEITAGVPARRCGNGSRRDCLAESRKCHRSS